MPKHFRKHLCFREIKLKKSKVFQMLFCYLYKFHNSYFVLFVNFVYFVNCVFYIFIYIYIYTYTCRSLTACFPWLLYSQFAKWRTNTEQILCPTALGCIPATEWLPRGRHPRRPRSQFGIPQASFFMISERIRASFLAFKLSPPRPANR